MAENDINALFDGVETTAPQDNTGIDFDAIPVSDNVEDTVVPSDNTTTVVLKKVPEVEDAYEANKPLFDFAYDVGVSTKGATGTLDYLASDDFEGGKFKNTISRLRAIGEDSETVKELARASLNYHVYHSQEEHGDFFRGLNKTVNEIAIPIIDVLHSIGYLNDDEHTARISKARRDIKVDEYATENKDIFSTYTLGGLAPALATAPVSASTRIGMYAVEASLGAVSEYGDSRARGKTEEQAGSLANLTIGAGKGLVFAGVADAVGGTAMSVIDRLPSLTNKKLLSKTQRMLGLTDDNVNSITEDYMRLKGKTADTEPTTRDKIEAIINTDNELIHAEFKSIMRKKNDSVVDLTKELNNQFNIIRRGTNNGRESLITSGEVTRYFEHADTIVDKARNSLIDDMSWMSTYDMTEKTNIVKRLSGDEPLSSIVNDITIKDRIPDDVHQAILVEDASIRLRDKGISKILDGGGDDLPDKLIRFVSENSDIHTMKELSTVIKDPKIIANIEQDMIHRLLTGTNTTKESEFLFNTIREAGFVSEEGKKFHRMFNNIERSLSTQLDIAKTAGELPPERRGMEYIGSILAETAKFIVKAGGFVGRTKASQKKATLNRLYNMLKKDSFTVKSEILALAKAETKLQKVPVVSTQNKPQTLFIRDTDMAMAPIIPTKGVDLENWTNLYREKAGQTDNFARVYHENSDKPVLQTSILRKAIEHMHKIYKKSSNGTVSDEKLLEMAEQTTRQVLKVEE